MDTVDKATRSKIMASVGRGRESTGPEIVLRKSLHRIGLRYKLHEKALPGSPDMVFPRFKAVLFVHGCFWHRHGCKLTTMPRTNVRFWREKFEDNIARDRRNTDALLRDGWRVAIVWECVLKGDADASKRLSIRVRDWLVTSSKRKTFGGLNSTIGKSKLRTV